MRVIIAQCTGQKRDGNHAARLLYDESNYFVCQRRYAEEKADKWFIQSAEYGLVSPDENIPSYDTHAKEIDRTEWASDIAADIDSQVHDHATIEVLGGKLYADPLTPELEALGYEVVEPLRGFGIGKRMSELNDRAETLRADD